MRVTTVILAVILAAGVASPALAQPADQAPPETESPETEPTADAPGEVIEIVDRAPPGSAHAIDADELETFERDDIHKVLAAVPGVYIRQEDGYGLRPNIGMRGTGSERSAKIALMEDDVLIAPAPYSAPAAYYFPLVTRMSRVEVVKGPAAVKHGPNTVGGALNLLTRQIPADQEVAVDIAGGADRYGKLHAAYGDRSGHLGWLIEGVGLRSDGFKELDGGGDTGFEKGDLMGKLRLSSAPTARIYHQVELKLAAGAERSNETYTGLTDADFAANPYRRYAATRLDRMEWEHLQGQLTYVGSYAGRLDLTARLYRNDFTRDWRKLNRFAGAELRDVLAAPEMGNNAVFYSVLTGDSDSSSPAETLMIGTNARSFVSEGGQLIARLERSWHGVVHNIEIGSRLHYDQVARLHTEDSFLMQGGQLLPDGSDTRIDRDTIGSTLAWASHYHHKVEVGPWLLSGGARAELIATHHRDHQDPAMETRDRYAVLIPGGGVIYRPLPTLGLLAGVHRGFAPVSPGQLTGVDPESSVNYEAGGRYADDQLAVELIGFYSDYQNLLGTCTFSTGCSPDQVDAEFNGGEVNAYGAELSAGIEPLVGELALPTSLVYTYQRSVFRTAFASSNPQWGDVEVGDELPYLPEHQLQLRAGVAASRWSISGAARFVGRMRDVAGQGPAADGELTDRAFVVDAAAHVRLWRRGELYLTVDNLLGQAHVVSRRPFGARPGAPRLIILGAKLTL